MAWQDGDELALLALATALALAQDKKSAGELGVLAAFLVAVADILALLAVVLATEENAAAAKKAKEAEERLEERLKVIEERLAACCEDMGKK